MGFSLSSITQVSNERPEKNVLSGPPGVGKTTFGVEVCKAKNGVFIPIEDGIEKLEKSFTKGVNRFPVINSWAELKDAHSVLMKEDHKFGALVIDTIDSGIPLLDTLVVQQYYGGNAREADEFKRKYNEFEREFVSLLTAWDFLIKQRKMEIWILCHCVVVNHKDPKIGEWQRYDLHLPDGQKTSLSKRLVNWADNVLFANYDVQISGKKGAGSERKIYTNWDAAYEAKNGKGLPDEIKFSYSDYLKAQEKK